MVSSIARYSATVSLLAAAYFATARLGLLFAIPPGNATSVWPNSGLALAALLLLGTRVWPGIWLGAMLANALTAVSLVTATAMATGNTIEALLGVWLFRHVLQVEDPFQRVEDAFWFAALAAVSSVVAALVGAGSLVLGGSMAWSQFAANAGTWWLGDMTSLLIVCPLLLALRQPRRQPLLLGQQLEVTILFALVAMASQGIFGGWLSEPLGSHLLYVPLVFLIWVALRFEFREVALTAGLFSGAAIWGTSRGVGPYQADALQQSLINLQIFATVYALTGLALAAVVARRRDAETQLRRAHDELEQRVRERTADLDRTNQDLRSEATVRRRAELALQALQELEHLQLATALECIDEGLLITDSQGTIQYVNPAFERITGYTRPEVIGKNPRILRSGQHSQAFYRTMWETIAAGKTWRGSFVDKRKDGQLYDVETTITPIIEPSGNQVGYTAISRDVTDRTQLAAAHEQLRVARTIQQKFFPTVAPDLPGFEIGGASYPAEATGGDYFDYFPLSDGRVGVVLADVSGHGLGPALIMSQTRAYLRALLTRGLNVSELVTRLSDFLIEDGAEDYFVTLFLAQIDPRDQSLVYASAGHQCYLLGSADEVELLESTGMVLGAVPQSVPQAEPRRLQPGQVVLFLTDGVQETAGPDEDYFGMERALAIVRANRDKSAREIVEELYLAARRFAQGRSQEDDITVVIVKVVGPFPDGGLQGAGI
ncbi:MAG: SpoIIE family protein phosphatase [Planctomycetota bacterium]|nr:SpoIIE family protein phosphatase [Planctomycetota bacterium]